jgi:hypothetical protein
VKFAVAALLDPEIVENLKLKPRTLIYKTFREKKYFISIPPVFLPLGTAKARYAQLFKG